MSGTATERTRSMSRAIARRSGSRRGWLMRASRSSALRSATISGSAEPVSVDCWIASRTAESMSDTAFSSRERDSDCSRSSIWPRCSATSETRASISATLAAASRAISSDWRASTRASADCSPLSCWRLTSSISSECTRCCVCQLVQAPPPASSASTRPVGRTQPGKAGAGAGRLAGRGADSGGADAAGATDAAAGAAAGTAGADASTGASAAPAGGTGLLEEED